MFSIVPTQCDSMHKAFLEINSPVKKNTKKYRSIKNKPAQLYPSSVLPTRGTTGLFWKIVLSKKHKTQKYKNRTSQWAVWQYGVTGTRVYTYGHSGFKIQSY